MPDNLIDLDKNLFLALNHLASPGVDPVMRFLSGPIPWIVFIIAFLMISWKMPLKKNTTHYLIIIASIFLAYALSEQISVHFFKDLFMRLRPCHEPSLAGKVRLVATGCGGQYGFVSTHAANAFNLAMLSALLIRRRWFAFSVFAWAILIGYSRIYLGVHYPGDVIGGAILGIIIAWAVYGVSRWIMSRTSVCINKNVKGMET